MVVVVVVVLLLIIILILAFNSHIWKISHIHSLFPSFLILNSRQLPESNELRYLICPGYTVDISVESHLYYSWLDEIFIQLPSLPFLQSYKIIIS